MSKHGKTESRIPPILAIPDKLEAFWKKLLSLRLPLYRYFSVFDFAFLLIAFILLIAGFTPWLSSARTTLCVISASLSLVPVLYHAICLVKERVVPVQEMVILVLTLLLLLTGESSAAVIVPLLAGCLYLVEAYAMLHREAEMERLETLDEELRMHTPDEERTGKGRVLCSIALAFFAFFILMALIFALVALFHRDNAVLSLRRCELFLLLSFPTAALFSFRLCHLGIFSSSSYERIVYRNDEIPELLSRCSIFAFSKTGTITDGRFRIGEICPVGISEEDLLRIAAVGECRSTHPIALAIRRAAGLRDDARLEGLQETEEIPGKGVSTFFGGRHIYVGNGEFLDEHGIWYQVPSQTGSAVHVAVDSTYRGYLMISDTIRENAFEALEELRAQRVSTLVMLTGDVRSAARNLAASMNFDMVKSGLQPEEKASAVAFLRSSQDGQVSIACVGDGFHDSDMFHAADVSVCLNAENDMDADIRIFSGEIMKIPAIYRFCRRYVMMRRICVFSVFGIKLLLCLLGLFTNLPVALIAVLDAVVGIGALVYALTSLHMNLGKNT
ncbi:MAG: HAD-IC family P-type ATPase [Oscillospiraceae bacterium]|nr:HAD-IC family P-type ATPase [Oscillospiraceae bacterium]MBR0392159.1 HAD-IC family P-type ATPase [Oscillospiraceae bacterium]